MELPFFSFDETVNQLLVMADNRENNNIGKSQFEWKTVSWDLNDPDFKFSLCSAFWDLFIVWLIWSSYGWAMQYFINWFWTWTWTAQWFGALWTAWFYDYRWWWDWVPFTLWLLGVLYILIAYDPFGGAEDVCNKMDFTSADWQANFVRAIAFNLIGGIIYPINPIFVIL